MGQWVPKHRILVCCGFFVSDKVSIMNGSLLGDIGVNLLIVVGSGA